MPDQKISDLTDGGAPQDTDELVIARAGGSFSLLFSAIKAAIPGGVSSVFGRTGAVVAANGDYTAAQVGALPSTDDLSAIATANATAASVAMNSHKLTGLAAGTGAGDSVRFEQIPTALPPNGTAGGDLAGTYPNPTVAKITEASGPTDLTIGTVTDGQFLKRVGSTVVSAAGNAGTVTSVTAGDTSIVVGGTGAAPTIATGTLDVIATNHAPAANWSNNSHKITSLANGAGAQDAAAFGQIPTALPPNGTAGGDLSGTYPNPAVKAITETSGPTDLTIGTITDGQFLKRSGSTLISAAVTVGSVTKQVPIPLSAPDATGNGYGLLVATANIREVFPAFVKDVDGSWWGVVRIPQDYSSAGTIICRVGANSTAGQVTSFIVATKVRDTAATWDTALTAETVVDTTMSTTAYRPTDVTFTLSTTPTAGADLVVQIEHNGTRTQDTLAVDSILFQCVFQYST